MTASSKKCRSGFTILELLMVIAIIVVLATIGLGAALYIINRAKKMSALAASTELQQGIQSYYDDHQKLPIELDEDVTISSTSPEGIQLLIVLRNDESSEPKMNSTGRNYINIKLGDNDIDGLIYNASGVLEGLVDPWGGDYKIRLDGDYNQSIDVQPKGAAKTANLKQRSAVWSDGKDGVDGVGKAADDVTTW